MAFGSKGRTGNRRPSQGNFLAGRSYASEMNAVHRLEQIYGSTDSTKPFEERIIEISDQLASITRISTRCAISSRKMARSCPPV